MRAKWRMYHLRTCCDEGKVANVLYSFEHFAVMRAKWRMYSFEHFAVMRAKWRMYSVGTLL